MTAPATPVEVVRALTALTAELSGQVKILRHAEMDAAVKRHTADMVRVRAFLAADGAMDFRENTAKAAADVPEGDAKVAEALVRVVRAEIRSIETRIEVGRTYAATVRAELSTLGAMPS